MSRFITALEGRWRDDDATFELTAPLVYQSDLYKEYQIEKSKEPNAGRRPCDGIINCAQRFVTDFASVPRVPLIYEMFGDRAHHESVPHDFMYQTHIVPKHLADLIFKEAMIVRGKPWKVYEGMYLGVFFGGGSSYRSGPSRFTILNTDTLPPPNAIVGASSPTPP